MPATSTSYVRFADGVEEIQPNENQLGDEAMTELARVRIKAYASSTTYRHAPNAQLQVEPMDISQLPD